jgi:ribosome biogenesis GTPase A
MENLSWRPGHMARAKRELLENVSLTDVIIEILDARIPVSSRNPELAEIAKNKKRLILLNKSDLADPGENAAWREKLGAILVDSKTGAGVGHVYKAAQTLTKEKIERQKARGRIFTPIRAMVVGIPNVGKSTLINRLAGKNAAKTSDRPGVTRSVQWIRIKKDLELLDAPGILQPKIENPESAVNLAIIGTVPDRLLNAAELANILLDKINFPGTLREIGAKKVFLTKGGAVDEEKTAIVVLDEYRSGKLGLITLEKLGGA